MQPTSRAIVRPDGLRISLVHQAGASRAAALVQVAAGSHDEPERWPGLAHLLEHLLFTGSRRYPDDSRLISWIQRVGGSVNATTQARRSAWFFEVDAPLLADGVRRLQDMLLAPTLEPAAIEQEIAVIDAENRLIQQHDPSRREAAVFHGVQAPAGFQRFQVGSAESFAGERQALREALTAFHQRHYISNTMQLWLQGPQSLEELEALAAEFCADLPAGAAPHPSPPILLAHDRYLQLETPAPAGFWYCPLLQHVGDNVTLLREFLLDAAPGSLLATLRERDAAYDVELKWLYQDEVTGWLALAFSGDDAEGINALLPTWLQALQSTTQTQQNHYYRLARQRFADLSPLEQLRQRAFGFAPLAQPVDFAAFCARLAAAPAVRLRCTKESVSRTVTTQGFTLPLTRWQPQPTAPATADFIFYPHHPPAATPPLPETSVPLVHIQAGQHPTTLILRPAFGSNFSYAEGQHRGQRLRPLFAELRHLGGHGEWRPVEGVWQLMLRLPEAVAAVEGILAAILQVLAASGGDADAPAQESVAIRHLLNHLADSLQTQPPTRGWLAALAGGSDATCQLLARRLSVLPTPVNASAVGPLEASPAGVTRLTHTSDDSALLLFIPLPDGGSLAALRALALLCEPLFFQRLRVELQIGYVVSCRYLRCADREGLLFALQSPDRSVSSLLGHCKRFLRTLPVPDETHFAQLKLRLKALIAAQPQAGTAALQALRQRQQLATFTQQEIDALQRQDLLALQQQLSRQRRRWRVLCSAGD
ncbi:coenzyme PQQ biosynthesis probable peptidase PqqF [Raoultella sp. BIGb0138]|uniref:pyrroloquinoline quinone biosynthesis protein PqqF n=1 Tax=Raoultella sp. BIGb0138 TaxID=2485115 RepID=UPI0010513446|nr:pyrroloquinoline quinone biosynthesis protein PqqF [Raoultella sp. BIGb0138]TCW09372.1 coenzyme PQQ biosynthesis probable peptidase PqqF [Raoultella sp. BIGb0138]